MPRDSPYAAAQRSGLSESIARGLRQAIEAGRLAPGGKLPSEQALARHHGVSRSVVREAISRLKGDGLVLSQQGRGVFVTAEEDRTAFRPKAPDLRNRTELAQIIELIAAVEVAATGLAARRRNQRQLRTIQRALAAIAAAVEKGESGIDEDLRFHTEIVRATQNPFFIDLASVLESRARKLIRAARSNTARYQGLVQEVQQEHVAILEAIEAGDETAARTAAEQHLRNAAERLALYQGRKVRKAG